MIICTNKMDYPLRAQCQRGQKQMVVNGEKERVSLLFMKALVSRSTVDSVSQQMAAHPQYLESFLRTQHYVLHMDGPLPLPQRHYIAIMAAARHNCNYLVHLHSAQFLRVGGDPLWLQDLQAAPARLRLLDQINKVLAHQPWLTSCTHIQALLKSGEQCWSLAELVQAVVILAHCHSLCSFVFGSDAESNGASLAKSPRDSPPNYCPFDAANGNTNVPQPLTPPLITHRKSLDSSADITCLKERIQRSQEECEKRDEQLIQTHTVQQNDLEEEEEEMCFADSSCFITDPDFCYQEFARRDDNHFQVFRVQDYSWEDHGFSLINRLYSDIGHLLDDRFRSVVTLPSLHSPDLRRAIWNYTHCVLGIRYDDYDYGEVNHLLEPDFKLYIKAVACFPDATKASVNPLTWTTAKALEQIHVNLLIMEARLQAELLYSLRAITQFMIL